MNFWQQELHRQKMVNDIYDLEAISNKCTVLTCSVYSRSFAFTTYN